MNKEKGIEYLPMPIPDAHVASTGSSDKELIVKVRKKVKVLWNKTLGSFQRSLESNLRPFRLDMVKQGKSRFMKQKPSRKTRKRIKRKYQ